MTNANLIIDNTTKTLITATSDLALSRLSIVNADSTTATISIKVWNGSYETYITPVSMTLLAGASFVLDSRDGIILKSGNKINITTNKLCHCSFNSLD
jgi:hypothetical protein